MRRVLLLVVLGAIAAYAFAATASRRAIDRLDADYAVIDLRGGTYKATPALAAGGEGSEDFEALVKRLQPYAAIVGTYYDENRRPLGDIVIEGKLANRGSQRQGIGFTSDGRIVFRERVGKSRIDWSGCRAGLACGPRLVRAGKKDIDVVRDGFSKVAATKEATRCAVGATANGRLVLLTVREPVTLSQVADAMIELGARDAINLDGGSLCAFYDHGSYLARPIMPVSNVLVVYKRK